MSREMTVRIATDAKRHEVQGRLVDVALWQSCVNCEHGETDAAAQTLRCALYKATPPPRVIAIGCESWEDCIPF